MQQHDRAGQDPQQRECPHADRTTEQVVEPRRACRGAGAVRRPRPRSPRGSAEPAPQDLRPAGGSALCQDVTVASRYRVSRSRGSVGGDPVERSLEKRQLIGEPGVRMVADRRESQPPALHQLVPAVARPRTFDRDASTRRR